MGVKDIDSGATLRTGISLMEQTDNHDKKIGCSAAQTDNRRKINRKSTMEQTDNHGKKIGSSTVQTDNRSKKYRKTNFNEGEETTRGANGKETNLTELRVFK